MVSYQPSPGESNVQEDFDVYRLLASTIVVLGIVCVPAIGQESSKKVLRAGIIGCDTSHVVAACVLAVESWGNHDYKIHTNHLFLQ